MNKQLALIAIIALTLIALALISLPTMAAPIAAPTPITAPGAAGTPANIVFFSGAYSITEDTRSAPLQLPAYNRLDLQYVVDQGDVNTVTLTFQTSCTGQNWDAGLAIVSANAADATAVQSYSNACRYQAVYADVANSNPITITVVGVAKQ